MPSQRIGPATLANPQPKRQKTQPPTTATHRRNRIRPNTSQRRRKPSAAPSPKPFPFLALPPEIRTQIYTYLMAPASRSFPNFFLLGNPFGSDTAVYTMLADDLRPAQHCNLFSAFPFPLPHPALGQINRQIRAEAIGEYLRAGTFVVAFQAGAADFVGRVSRYWIRPPYRRTLGGKENEVCCYRARHGPACEARKKEGEKLDERDLWGLVSRFKAFVSYVRAEPVEVDYEDGFEV